MAGEYWRNWAGNQRCRPTRVSRPRGTEDVARAVLDAERDGLQVRVCGAGHSFTPAVVTDGVLMDLRAMARLRRVHASTGEVTVEAGMTLRELSEVLDRYGRALTNLGDIDSQTVAGAIATSTHGTGRDSGGLAAQVSALTMVLADGTVTTCSAADRPDLLDAARVSLGALGVITEVTVRTEPAFHLHAVERPMPLPDVLAGLDELTRDNEHFEFYWFPHTRDTLTKRNNRSDGPGRALSRSRAWVDDVLVSNHLFGLACRMGRRLPSVIPRVNRLASRLLSGREYVDASYRVFTSPRRVRFLEMEYAVPRADLAAVLDELRGAVDRHDWRISFPVEVRVAPGDEPWLSTANGRDSAYIAVHQYPGSGLDAYFDTAERIFVAAAGRPHWGKLHTRNAEYLAGVYPSYARFTELRNELDPRRRFVNEYVTRSFGH